MNFQNILSNPGLWPIVGGAIAVMFGLKHTRGRNAIVGWVATLGGAYFLYNGLKQSGWAPWLPDLPFLSGSTTTGGGRTNGGGGGAAAANRPL